MTDLVHRARDLAPAAAVVMTMGALHEGHAALIRAARARAGSGQVTVTVFVNPLQFGPGEDLDRYPRTLDADLKLAEQAGADVVFAPDVAEVYPGGRPQVRISAGPMGEVYEGAARPGHFDGMLTVVAKLLHLTRPRAALFGQKDAQQLALIRRMVTDLNFPVTILAVPTVREPDGLALSSRNRYLSAEERTRALALSRALFAGRDAAAGPPPAEAGAAGAPGAEAGPGTTAPAADGQGGERSGGAPVHPAPVRSAGPEAVLAAARAEFAAGGLHADYLDLIDPSDFTPAGPDHTGPAVLAVAAKVGTTRLIDNIPLEFGAPE